MVVTNNITYRIKVPLGILPPGRCFYVLKDQAGPFDSSNIVTSAHVGSFTEEINGSLKLDRVEISSEDYEFAFCVKTKDYKAPSIFFMMKSTVVVIVEWPEDEQSFAKLAETDSRVQIL